MNIKEDSRIVSNNMSLQKDIQSNAQASSNPQRNYSVPAECGSYPIGVPRGEGGFNLLRDR